jgi:outer membrane lipopolysaccharide assembly protein LptE/RlpB
MRGTTLDQAVNTELLRRYRENPKQAVLLSRDQQEALAEHIRQQIINGQLPPRS